MDSINDRIKFFTEEGYKSIRADKSKAGERVRVKIIRESFRKNRIYVHYEIIGKTGECYDQAIYTFPGTTFAYYKIEVLKASLLLYWSGRSLSKRDLRRLEFIEKHGEQNTPYLNRSLRNIHILKKACMFWKWKRREVYAEQSK